MTYDASTISESFVTIGTFPSLSLSCAAFVDSSSHIETGFYLFAPQAESVTQGHVSIERSFSILTLASIGLLGHARGTDPTTSYFTPCAPACFKSTVVLGSAQYAILSNDGLSVSNVQEMTPAFINSILVANPVLIILPVTMIAQPVFDPLTQMVSQDGWTISDTDVQPIWVIEGQTPEQQAASLVLVSTDLQLDLVNWLTLTTDDKDTVLQRLTQVVTLILVRYKDALIV